MNTDQFLGTVWKDFNGHELTIRHINLADDGWYELSGDSTGCKCPDVPRFHDGSKMMAYAEDIDDLESGRIFGFYRKGSEWDT